MKKKKRWPFENQLTSYKFAGKILKNERSITARY